MFLPAMFLMSTSLKVQELSTNTEVLNSFETFGTDRLRPFNCV